jgi:hypothetical protein
MIYCHFENLESNCSLDDFEYTQIYIPVNGKNFDCFTFNSGENLRSSSKIGMNSGLTLFLNLSRTEKLFFVVHDNNERPTYSHLNSNVEQASGKLYRIAIEKTLDIKLQKPFTNCTSNINSETSYLVKEILKKNISYNRKYCYDKCYSNYLNNYKVSRNLTHYQAFSRLKFDFKGNCSHLCPLDVIQQLFPLECYSTFFELSQTEMELNPGENFLWLQFFFSDRQYTEISETEKTTSSDLISNTGGVLGLFLELSFFSAYRFILFLFDLISV